MMERWAGRWAAAQGLNHGCAGPSIAQLPDELCPLLCLAGCGLWVCSPEGVLQEAEGAVRVGARVCGWGGMWACFRTRCVDDIIAQYRCREGCVEDMCVNALVQPYWCSSHTSLSRHVAFREPACCLHHSPAGFACFPLPTVSGKNLLGQLQAAVVWSRACLHWFRTCLVGLHLMHVVLTPLLLLLPFLCCFISAAMGQGARHS